MAQHQSLPKPHFQNTVARWALKGSDGLILDLTPVQGLASLGITPRVAGFVGSAGPVAAHP